MKVLVACEYSGRVRDAFIAKGHDAISCDLLPTDSPGPHHQGNVLEFAKSQHFDLMIAHPPCTRLANSGVRWLHEPPKNAPKDADEITQKGWANMTKERKLAVMWHLFSVGVLFYQAIRSLPIEKKCIENPVMHGYAIDKLGKVSRQTVQPWWFGEKTFKATGYELHGLPRLTATDRLTPPKPGTEEHKQWSWIHRASPGPGRWKIRSTTPIGIAQAMAEQWG